MPELVRPAAIPTTGPMPVTPAARHAGAYGPPTSTLSSTLRFPNTRPCWNVRARPRLASSSAGSPVMSHPSNRTFPASGVSSPVTRLKTVVLPAPLGPMMLTSSPSATVSAKSLTAVTPPKRRVRPVSSSSAVIASHGPEQALRAEADEQQEGNSVEQHAVLRRGAEQFRQAYQGNGAQYAAGDIAEAAEDHHGQGQQGNLRR